MSALKLSMIQLKFWFFEKYFDYELLIDYLVPFKVNKKARFNYG